MTPCFGEDRGGARRPGLAHLPGVPVVPPLHMHSGHLPTESAGHFLSTVEVHLPEVPVMPRLHVHSGHLPTESAGQ